MTDLLWKQFCSVSSSALPCQYCDLWVPERKTLHSRVSFFSAIQPPPDLGRVICSQTRSLLPFYMRQKVLSKTPPTDTCLNLFLPPALGHLVNGKTVMKREKGKKPEMKWSPQHVWSLQQKQEGRASSFLLRFLPHRSCSDLWEAYTILKTHEVITFRLDIPLSEMKDWSHGSSAYIVYNFLPPELHFV